MTSLVVASSIACNTCKHRLAFEYVKYRELYIAMALVIMFAMWVVVT